MFEKLKRVDLPLSMAAAMEDTAPAAIGEQREQLSQGLRSDGSFLPDYSFRSVFQYGKPPGPIRLYDTGDFYRAMLMDVRQDIFILESADPKSTMLQNRYGEDILGLRSEALNNYIVTLNPVFITHIQNYLK
jgi:hypothetical protein